MINETETEEKAHLQGVKIKLQTALERIDSTLRDHAMKIQEQKTYLWEHRTDMDHAEKVSTRQSAEQRVLAAEAVLNNKKRIVKLLQSPYFGRFDFLIISPNKVFADYISNVLPELGEENIAETEMEILADDWLDYKYKFQTFFQQAALLLEKNDEKLRQRIQGKSSLDFLKKLDEYATYIEKSSFCAEDLQINCYPISARFIEESFQKHRGMSVVERTRKVAQEIEHNIDIYQHYELTKEERDDLRTSLKKMQKRSTLRGTYKNFFTWMGKPELFKPGKNSILEYSDVFPLIYLKIRLEGIKGAQKNVKHLLIDEMQDYTPVQYAVIAKLFPCKKTILGDADQSVNPFSSSTAEKIQKVFRQAECVKLCKSYRSTYEITRFAQRISPNPDLVAIERHGDEPRVLKFKSKSKEIERIRQLIEEFVALGYHTMGIICKTPNQVEHLHGILHSEKHHVRLLTSPSRAFTKGVVICTVHLAKGLEFDQVIVPDVDEDNYSTDIERNLLYVACTRAMHILTLTFTGKASPFITREWQ